jgi:hypothetical protein
MDYEHTRITLPVKVIFRLARTSQVQTFLFIRGAMREWDMVVSDVIPEVDLIFL